MNATESHLKDRFGNEALADPAGQAALWASIEGQMHSGKRKPAFAWWMFGALTFVLGAGFTWFYIAPSPALQVEFDGASNAKLHTGYNKAIAGSDLNFSDVAKIDQQANAKNDLQEMRNLATGATNLTTRTSSGGSGDDGQTSNFGSGENTSLAQAGLPPFTPQQEGSLFGETASAPTSEASNLGNTGTKSTPASPSYTPPSNRSSLATPPSELTASGTVGAGAAISRSTNTLLPIPALSPLFEQRLEGEFVGFENEQHTPSLFSMRLYAGPNMSRTHIVGAHHDTHNPYQSADIGSTIGLSLNRRIGQHSAASVGVEWNNYWNHFDIERITTSIDSLPNQVVEYIINGVTGDTVEVVYGTAAVTTETTRRVVHHNRYRTIGIPVEFSREFNLGQLRAGLGIGAVIHLRQIATGRGLNAAGEIVSYVSFDAPQNKVMVSPRLRPYLAYPINERLQLDVSASWGWQRQFSGEVKSNMLFYNFQLGLTRNF